MGETMGVRIEGKRGTTFRAGRKPPPLRVVKALERGIDGL
jgi:hypothetical protein